MQKVVSLLVLVFFLITAPACEKEYDYPPRKEAKAGARVSIQQLKARLTAPANYYRFAEGDTNLYCLVLNDERSGNFYKEISVRDEQGSAILLHLKESGGLYTGDKIRINLNHTYLILANNMVYLDSVDVAKNVVKLSSGNPVTPIKATYEEIMMYSSTPTHTKSLQSQLIELSGVEFLTNTLVPSFADAIGKTTVNQTLTTCEPGKWLTVRTSGRSNFAGKKLPNGNGSVFGILSQYNNTMQLTIRDYSDVEMNKPRCAAPSNTLAEGTYLVKDFNDASITSGNWQNISVTNTLVNWYVGTSSLAPSPFARISGYVGGNSDSEVWLISPPLDISKAKNALVSFNSAAKFSGTALEVLVSTNYTSGNPTLTDWTSLAPNYLLSPASGDYLWTYSGQVSLNAYKSANIRLAFRYISTNSGATSYYLDDIVVKEK